MLARSRCRSPVALLGGALSLLLLAGCRETSRAAPQAQSLVGRACSVDAECAGLRCDPVRRHCICRSDEDCSSVASCAPGGSSCTKAEECCGGSCESGRCGACAAEGDTCGGGCCAGLVCGEDDKCALPVCNNFTGLCVAAFAGCRSDLDCPAGEWCDRTVRACKARKGFCEPCVNDLECGGSSDLCLEAPALGGRFCGAACDPANQNRDCLVMAGSGASCQSLGGGWQCWPKEGRSCELFVGCTPDSRSTCVTDADCGDAAQVCDAASGLCLARVRDCPFGQVCDARSKVCVDACVSDADCVAIDASLRCVNQGCEAPSQCAASAGDATGDSSCPPNRICSFVPGTSAGLCVPFCASDAECPPGNLCLRSAQGRSRCTPGCRTNADCLAEQKCVKPPGQSVGLCAGTPGQTCQTGSACALCSSCDTAAMQCTANPQLGYCKPCGSDADCGSGHCLALQDASTGQVDNRCGQPCPREGCPRGLVCAEVCLGGEFQGYRCSGQLVAQCIPADQSCTVDDGSGARVEKCVWSQ